MIYGIDAAGRGPLLGPRVVAVVGIPAELVATLQAAGFRDSKAFGSSAAGKKKRGDLYRAMLDMDGLSFVQDTISVERIDDFVGRGELNLLEQLSARRSLEWLRADKAATIYADGAALFRPLQDEYPNLIAVNNGESAHVAVAAASILAKHMRDTAMADIEHEYERQGYGKISGGGYLNPGTYKFLDAYRARNGGALPPEARKSWKLTGRPAATT